MGAGWDGDGPWRAHTHTVLHALSFAVCVTVCVLWGFLRYFWCDVVRHRQSQSSVVEVSATVSAWLRAVLADAELSQLAAGVSLGSSLALRSA